MTPSNLVPENDHPLVSIVTPSFNAMPYIKETIESVLLQDYPRIEHIVMDGGSTDGTKEFLQSQNHLIWKSEPDRGQSQAINKGFQIAKGDIIGWLNADDTYRSGVIQDAVNFFNSHKSIDIIYTDVLVVDEKGQKIRLAKGEPYSLWRLLYSNIVKQPTVFMRKHVLDSLIGVDESLEYVMDHEFWLRAGIEGFNLKYLPDTIFANFRFCKGTKSYNDSPLFLKEWIRVLNNLSISNDDPVLFRKLIIAKKNKLSQYYFSLMANERQTGSIFHALFFFIKAISINWKCFFQIGIWKLFIRTFVFYTSRKNEKSF